MLSDFGTSRDRLNTARARTGNTGTLEYTAPESLNAMHSLDSKADMWSLGGGSTAEAKTCELRFSYSTGMILHKLLFFRLPYVHDDIIDLEKEVAGYQGSVFRRQPYLWIVWVDGFFQI